MKLLIAALLILFIVLQYRLWFGEDTVRTVRGYQNKIHALEQEAERRHERNLRLEAEVADLKSGLEAVEERARQDLGMIRDGETFFQVIEPPSHPGSSTDE